MRKAASRLPLLVYPDMIVRASSKVHDPFPRPATNGPVEPTHLHPLGRGAGNGTVTHAGRLTRHPPHDPLLCGLGPGYDCAGCATTPAAPSPIDQAYALYKQLAIDHRLPRPRPAPPDPNILGSVVLALLSPQHRPLLREVLLDLLADDMADIATAVAREVSGGY